MRILVLITFTLACSVSGAAEAEGLWMACHVKELCAGVAPGGGRILDCLRAHRADLSKECLDAIGSAVLNRPGKAQQESTAAPGADAQPK